MSVAMFVSLLLAATAQNPPVDPHIAVSPQVTEEQNGNVAAQEPVNGDTEHGLEDEYLAEEPAEPIAQPVASEAAEPAPEEGQPMTCKRRTVYDMIGRPRSTRVCRPRDEW